MSRANELQAQALLDRALVEQALGDASECRRLTMQGLALVRGTFTPSEAGLLIVLSQLIAWEVDAAETFAAAREAVAVARRAGAHRGRAEYVLAQAHYVAESPKCIQGFARARALCAAEGDVDGEFEAWFAVAISLYTFSSAVEAIEQLESLHEAATQAAKPVWQRQASWGLSRTRWLAFGESEIAIESFRRLSRTRGLGLHRPQVLADLGLAYADLGEFDEARAALTRSRSAGLEDTRWARCINAYYRAEIDWAAGQASRGLGRIERELATDLPRAIETWVRETRLWLLFDLAKPVHDPALIAKVPFFAGAASENRAFAALSSGDLARAEAELLAAADTWSRFLVRYELRARWGAALLAARLGRAGRRRSRNQLHTVERRAAELGFAPLLGRARAALEGLFGASVSLSPPMRLTNRQREILRLVERGNSSKQIAAQLGLSPRTVDVHVRAARDRLGASTRLEAIAKLRDSRQARMDMVPPAEPLIELLAQGHTVAEASARLAISRRTATRRLGRIRAELRVRTNVEAIAASRRRTLRPGSSTNHAAGPDRHQTLGCPGVPE